jgi:DNA invertase Pin-like site-specific DNA recombinase
MSRQDEWTRDSESAALERLRAAAVTHRQAPILLVYTRQSVSDFDADGRPRGPSLSQQLDAVLRRPELEGLAFEHFEDADRSGKETSRRPGYLALMERVRSAPAGQIGAVAFYDADRLHRNDVEFFRFMAEMTERRILVFDTNGLISNVDRLSWKIKAIVAQEEREKVSRRVRDNLRYLRRNGQLLGTIPQGYRRVDGRIVEDPDAAPAIREIFRLYASGRFSLRSLAEHLNRSGIKPYRGPDKANHNRSKAIIFTGDVLKDLIGNPSYAGKVLVEGELVQGLHPALVDEETWRACQDIKKRNVRRTSKAWTKHTYPLTPILLCARCGGPMHGEADSRRGRIQRYYGCHVARRNRSAIHPSGPRCDARMFKSELLEDAIHHELSQLVPSGEMHAALRNRLRAAGRATASRTSTAAAVQRLAAQFDRARRLFEYGEYDWETFCKRRDELNEQRRHLENATEAGSVDVEWCESQLLDFTTAWEKADSSQRERLVAGIFEHLEAEALPEGSLRVVAVPREAWRPFFEGLVLERETGFEPATSTLARSRSTK